MGKVKWAWEGIKWLGTAVATKVVEVFTEDAIDKGKEMVAVAKTDKEPLNNQQAIQDAYGNYSTQRGSDQNIPQMPGIVINQNYYISGNGRVDAPVTIAINNIGSYDKSDEYIREAQKQGEKPVLDASKQKSENNEKYDKQIDGSIATNALKTFLKFALLPKPLLIVDAAIKTAQVIIENKQTKEAVVADVAKNMPEIEKIQDGNKVYNIVRGDSLWKIANENGTTVAGLREANPWLNDRFSPDGRYALIRPGEKLNMPGSVESMVQQDLNVSKEDLARIADKNSFDANKTLAETNKVQDVKTDDDNSATCSCGH